MIDFAPYIAAIAAFVGAIFAAFAKGKASANTKHQIEKADANEATHERINEVQPVDPSDHDDVVKRLRKRGQ